MSLRIQHNLPAMGTHRNLSINDNLMSKSLERLSSGFRINRAADDAAGLSISEQMRADIASLNMGSRNVSEANSLLQVAEGAMSQISNMLVRIKELATQAASANAASNLPKIDAEAQQLLDEIDRIANTTEYAGSKLINGTFGVTVSAGSTLVASLGYGGVSGLQKDVTYTIATAVNGSNFDITVSATIGGQQISQTLTDIAAPAAGGTSTLAFNGLGLAITFNENLADATEGTLIGSSASAADFQVGNKNSLNDVIGIELTSVLVADIFAGNTVDLSKADTAKLALGYVDTAMSNLNTVRGDIGAVQNRLSYASATLATTIENTTAAESAIRDVDMAAEMTAFTKTQILVQAGTAMLAQANSSPNLVLSLFQ